MKRGSLVVDAPPAHGPFCECELDDCRVLLPLDAWDDVRDRILDTYPVTAGHVQSDERIVAIRQGWVLVSG